MNRGCGVLNFLARHNYFLALNSFGFFPNSNVYTSKLQRNNTTYCVLYLLANHFSASLLCPQLISSHFFSIAAAIERLSKTIAIKPFQPPIKYHSEDGPKKSHQRKLRRSGPETCKKICHPQIPDTRRADDLLPFYPLRTPSR